jgi:hypothetical protein
MTLVPTSHSPATTSFDVVLVDGTHETVDGVDAYQQESSMTTFFRNGSGRQAVDCWSVRVASFRTDQILAIRRHDEQLAGVRRLHPA